MATWLKNTLSIVAPAGASSFPHNLIDPYNVPQVPDLLAVNDFTPSGAAFTITANSTNVLINNTSGAPITMQVYVESWHTIERTFGDVNTLDLPIQPFVIGHGSGGGGGLDTLQTAYNNGAAGIQRIIEGGFPAATGGLDIEFQARPAPAANELIFSVTAPGGFQRYFETRIADLGLPNISTLGNTLLATINTNGQRTFPGLVISSANYIGLLPGNAPDVSFDLDSTATYDGGAASVPLWASIEVAGKSLLKGTAGLLQFDATAILILEPRITVSGPNIGTTASWCVVTDHVLVAQANFGHNWFRGTLTIGDLPVSGVGQQLNPTPAEGMLVLRGTGAAATPVHQIFIDSSRPASNQAVNGIRMLNTAIGEANLHLGGLGVNFGVQFNDSTQLLTSGAGPNHLVMGTVDADNVYVGASDTVSFIVVGSALTTNPANTGYTAMDSRRFETSRGGQIIVQNGSAGVPITYTLDGDGNVFELRQAVEPAAPAFIGGFVFDDWQVGTMITIVLTTDQTGVLPTLVHNVGATPLFLNGGVDYDPQGPGACVVFVRGTTGWYQVAAPSETGINAVV